MLQATATWVPGEVEEPAPDDALREVTRRALSAYAPLTPTDLARWWLGGAGPARGATMLRELGNEAVEVDVEGEPHWVLARDVPGMVAATIPNTARLLPAFDPWVIGASRTAVSQLEAEHRARVYRRQGWISPVVLVNGQMVGVWKHEVKRDQLRVEIESFGELPLWAISQVEAEAERLAAFFGRGLNFCYSTNDRASPGRQDYT